MKYFKLLLIIFYFNYINSVYSQLKDLDNFIINSINNKIFPGAVLLISKDNNIIYHKAFGHFTYDPNSKKITLNTLFDIASITKVVATTTSAMFLFEQNNLVLDDYVSKYFDSFKTEKKSKIKISDLLLHTSGLPGYLDHKIIDNLKDKPEKLKEIILNIEPVTNSGNYVYSCLNFIILRLIIERISGIDFENFIYKNIISLLKLKNTMFNPIKFGRQNDCAPTGQNHQGIVQDPLAQVFFGISGNAGLFSTAYDLYLFILAINNNNFINKNIFEFWTTNHTGENNRAFGWATAPDKNYSCGDCISKNSFGHLGFTGTSIWYDKDKKMCVIFLSNRIYQSHSTEKIIWFRRELHNIIFKQY